MQWLYFVVRHTRIFFLLRVTRTLLSLEIKNLWCREIRIAQKSDLGTQLIVMHSTHRKLPRGTFSLESIPNENFAEHRVFVISFLIRFFETDGCRCSELGKRPPEHSFTRLLTSTLLVLPLVANTTVPFSPNWPTTAECTYWQPIKPSIRSCNSRIRGFSRMSSGIFSKTLTGL